ncbi:ATP-binding protein [archaeon]|jgi:predicted ATPase|nr:ATP-binding protein [archaeon]MBT4396931.1 ATP-binding protein [archaeon]MBT4440922.1 ATP-binding protein [archaeon]
MRVLKKYVLTGGPSSGKTSILLELEQRGYSIIREAAEDWIKLQQSRGIKEPWLIDDFQERILDLQIKRELEISYLREKHLVVDRGVLDSLAYYEVVGRDYFEIPIMNRISRTKYGTLPHRIEGYDKVFLIENIGTVESTEVRREDLEAALKLEELQYRAYVRAGFSVERIAAWEGTKLLTVTQRTDLIEAKMAGK